MFNTFHPHSIIKYPLTCQVQLHTPNSPMKDRPPPISLMHQIDQPLPLDFIISCFSQSGADRRKVFIITILDKLFLLRSDRTTATSLPAISPKGPYTRSKVKIQSTVSNMIIG